MVVERQTSGAESPSRPGYDFLLGSALESDRAVVVSGTGSPATEVLVIQNPSDETATAAVTTFVGGEEQVLADEVEVPAAGRATLILEEATLGGPFAVLIESDRPVITERRLFFGDDEDTAGSSPSRWPALRGPSRSSDGCPLVDCRGAGSDRARRGLVPPGPAPSYPSAGPRLTSLERVERSDFRGAAPWLLAVFTAHDCETCGEVLERAASLGAARSTPGRWYLRPTPISTSATAWTPARS